MKTSQPRPLSRRSLSRLATTVLLSLLGLMSAVAFAQEKPNILILFPDDVGWQNVSAYGLGTMGYRTPNIDRIAREGVMFTDHYAQPSCTAGRAALITGQYPIRSGMTTVGRPGAELGLRPESHTLAEVLKNLGYATGQFGKNHLGDRNEHLPTVHGFDEFFGNLYHLNTQEEFEQVDYPKDPEFFRKFGTRGVLHTYATDVVDETVDPRFGKVGKQKIEDTGQLSRERMKTMDQEFMDASLEFIRRAKDDGQPFFVWFNPSRMHMYTRLSDESRYLAAEHTTEHDFYGSGLIEHDRQIGAMLDALEKMGVLDNTIIIYSTDNGPEHSARLHGGTTPFRGEKMTTYEGGVRVPMMVRWPGKIPGNTVLSGIQTHMDIYTTLAAAAGEPDIADKVLEDHQQPIDGVNNLDYWLGKSDESARDHFFYYYESGIKAIRYQQWKLHFETSENYYAPYEKQKFPIFYNIRMDPFESFDSTTDRSDIVQAKQWLNEPVQHLLAEHIASLSEYPPVQRAATFDFSSLMDQLLSGKQ
ncbi:arylsulfatase [Marinobacter caseinilyticus]|uniref:arylsulfatase n=1 Tax=Marinobacter caseinilyticus TaxID=2692195 RepID=UPI001A9492CA|nr:arylsulfatase [Marinobacter caseinilyticus]